MKKFLITILIILLTVGILVGAVFLLFPRKYENYINLYAEKYNLSKTLVTSIINVESGYDEKAKSNAGAIGLMQILPETAKDCAKRIGFNLEEKDLFNPEKNIEIGCFYLRYLLDLFDGNLVNSLCAYNWGLGNVRDWIDRGNCDEWGTIKNIPVSETKNYIKKVKVCIFVYSKIFNID
jgi:soluble lytic murein transglycosylase